MLKHFCPHPILYQTNINFYGKKPICEIENYIQYFFVFAYCLGDKGSIPDWVIPKTQKLVLDAFLLNTQYYKVRIKDKWSNSRKVVTPSPTPRCSIYFNGSLQVFLKISWFNLKCNVISRRPSHNFRLGAAPFSFAKRKQSPLTFKTSSISSWLNGKKMLNFVLIHVNW